MSGTDTTAEGTGLLSVARLDCLEVDIDPGQGCVMPDERVEGAEEDDVRNQAAEAVA
jgi:hypothetical protein